MKYISFIFIYILFCICFMQIEAQETSDSGIEDIQKKLAEGFDSVRKAAEEMAAKVDFKQIQQDFTSKLEELAKSFNDFTSSAAEKKTEGAP